VLHGQWKIELCLCQWWIQQGLEVVAAVVVAADTAAMKMWDVAIAAELV
jgi:hypothetical protein